MKIQSDLKSILLGFTLTCITSLSFGQTYFYFDGLEVTPNDPSTGDDICLEISGLKSTPCVFYQYFDVFVTPYNEVVVDMCWQDTAICIQILDPWDTTACIGPLAPGEYEIYFQGCNHDAFGEIFNFEVSPGGNAPFANFEPAFVGGCLPFEINFQNLSQNADTFFWDFGDGNTSTEENPVYSYSSGGMYTVSLTATNSSTGESHTFTAPDPFIILDEPMPDIGPDQTMTTADTLTLTAAYAWSEYYWEGPGLSSTADESQYVIVGSFVDPGTYTITLNVVTEAGCEGTAQMTLTVEEANSTQEIQTDVLQVFPNPVKNSLSIRAKDISMDLETYRLVNIQGITVMEGNFPSSKQIELNNLNIPSGFYTLIVNTSDQTFTEKIVVQ